MMTTLKAAGTDMRPAAALPSKQTVATPASDRVAGTVTPADTQAADLRKLALSQVATDKPADAPLDPRMVAYARVKATITDGDGNTSSTIDGTATQQGDQTQYSDTFSSGESGTVTQQGNQVSEQFNISGTPDSSTSYTYAVTQDGAMHLKGTRQTPDGTPCEAIAIDVTSTPGGSHLDLDEKPLDGKSAKTHTTADITTSQNAQGFTLVNIEATETVDANTVHISAQVTNGDKTPVSLVPIMIGLLA